jgi:hypothetical protein
MEKINKNIKLKIIILFILSNSSTYLLSSTESREYHISTPQTETFEQREGYITVSISAEAITNSEPNLPISILSSKNSMLIPHGFLIKKNSSEISDTGYLSESNMKNYTVHVPSKYLTKLLDGKSFKIIPYGAIEKNAKKKRMVNYEFNY